MVLDDGAVLAQDVALIGARNLDPPEVEFIAAAGIHTGDDAIERALEGADAVYVALDADSLEPGDLAVFMPEPDGLRLTEVEKLLRRDRCAEANRRARLHRSRARRGQRAQARTACRGAGPVTSRL